MFFETKIIQKLNIFIEKSTKIDLYSFLIFNSLLLKYSHCIFIFLTTKTI